MHVIGIVGGVASGKSLVADELRSLGATVLDADRVGHEVLCEPEVEAALRARWGDRVFDIDGRVNRRAVSKIVFAPPPAGPSELAFLESVSHPRIGARLAEDLAEMRKRGNVPAVVLDAALLFRGGWDKLCDRILFIDAPRDLRLKRAQSRGWTAEHFAAREAAQEPIEEKRRRSQVTIDNSGTTESAKSQVRSFWNGLTTAR